MAFYYIRLKKSKKSENMRDLSNESHRSETQQLTSQGRIWETRKHHPKEHHPRGEKKEMRGGKKTIAHWTKSCLQTWKHTWLWEKWEARAVQVDSTELNPLSISRTSVWGKLAFTPSISHQSDLTLGPRKIVFGRDVEGDVVVLLGVLSAIS